jgi:hypothetical protein
MKVVPGLPWNGPNKAGWQPNRREYSGYGTTAPGNYSGNTGNLTRTISVLPAPGNAFSQSSSAIDRCDGEA